jgi:hypothetical protein
MQLYAPNSCLLHPSRVGYLGREIHKSNALIVELHQEYRREVQIA